MRIEEWMVGFPTYVVIDIDGWGARYFPRDEIHFDGRHLDHIWDMVEMITEPNRTVHGSIRGQLDPTPAALVLLDAVEELQIPIMPEDYFRRLREKFIARYGRNGVCGFSTTGHQMSVQWLKIEFHLRYADPMRRFDFIELHRHF